jgi:hypothetical protein
MMAAAWPVSGQVTTYHYDLDRTGANPNETILNTSNVNVNTFGKLFTLPVDGEIYAQPLYVPSVNIPQNGVHNVVYIATEHNSVYAYDADSPSSSGPLWHVNLGPSMPTLTCCWNVELLPEIGITSTPVIDLSSNTMYVVAESYESGVTYFRVHALDITTGADRVTPAVVQGSVPGTSYDAVNGIVTFSAIRQLQRPGLLLVNGNVYVGFGSHQDNTPYHGWLFAYSASTLQQTGMLCFSPAGDESGLWQGGVAPAADLNGNVYVDTGNGLMNVNTGGQDYGDSILKIGMSANGLAILDYFSPTTELLDQENDWDLGSSGPLLIPGTSLGLAAGKDGVMRVFNTANLGQFHASGDQLPQEWQATYAYSYSPPSPGGYWGGNYIFYNNMMYGFAERDTLKAYSFNGSQFNPIPVAQSTMSVASASSNDPGISISANGTASGTVILWASCPASGNGDAGLAQPAIIRAFDASNVATELWDSGQNATRDSSGNWAKWVPPIVANGKLYVATYDGDLAVYGLLSGYESITATAGTPQSATVNTAFTTALQAVVKDAGGNPLSGVSVTFAAPASGASATFAGSPTVTTNGSGVATAPAVTSNGQAGSYTITASVAGVSTPASFSLTNLTGAPASIAATAGTPQSATVNTAFGNLLQAIVKDGNGNALSGVSVTFAAPSSGASATFGGSTTVTTNASGVATSPSLTANAQAGSYTATASVAGVNTPASFSLTNTPSTAGTGTMTGSGNSNAGTFNLTTEGVSDWVNWGNIYGGPGIVDRKAAVPVQISNYTEIGSIVVATTGNDPRTLIWSDGTRATSGSDNVVVYVDSNSGHPANGFSFTVPGDTNLRTLVVHAGGQDGGGTLTASLSDGSANNYQDTTANQSGRWDRNYTITYSAGSAGQTLTIQWISSTASGNVSLGGAAVSLAVSPGSPASVSATAGALQSATVNTAFTTALQATVKDINGNPLSGVTVTFAAPASGASATFGGSTTVTTNSSGAATAPALTANGQAGSYPVTATVAGVSTPASFTLTNVAGPPAVIVATAGSSQSTTVSTAFATALQATVKDINGNPLSGVSVTFAGPASGASATFGAPATVTTNANGVATAPALTANGQAGSYTVTASVAGVTTPASFSLTNLAAGPATVTATAGTPQSATVNAAFATVLRATVKDNDGNLLSGVSVTFAAPASGASGAFGGPATVTTNSGGVAAAPALTANGQAGSYTVTASVAGVTAPASFSLTNLAAGPASITGTAGTPQSATVNTAFANALQATVKDGNGNLLSGVSVTFAAPASGASAAFGGSATVTTNTSGVATAPTLTANGQAGSYTVTASVSGVTTPAGFSLTNTAATTGGSGSLSGSGNSNTGTFNLTGEGTSDWVTWGNIYGGPGLVDRKAGVTAQISNYTEIGSLVVATTGNDPRTLTWSDGTRATSGSNNVAVYVDSNSGHAGNGFSFTVPADTNTRTLVFHAGGQDGGGTLTASLSDGSAANYQDTTANQSGRWDRNYTITYSAGTAGQNLTVRWVSATASGSVNLGGAAVSFAGPAVPASSITTTAGSPQSATVNTAFTTALQAVVKDINGNPLSGVSVTFAAPASGASATFGGSPTVLTTSSGVATVLALTANGQAGSYTVTASVAGVTTPASFSLTNLAGPPAGVTATGGTPQSASVNAAFATALKATVKDGSGNPLSGVSVTFAAPASGASATFGGSATVTTSTSGVATAPALTANGQAGSYTVTASVAGVTNPASFSLTNLAGTPASVTATAGTPQSATVNAAFATALQATVKDGGGNPLSGVSVTFAAPASGASVTFGGSATVSTNTSGVATAPALTANSQAGSYTVTASVAGVTTPASFSLTNTAATTGGTGTLSGSANFTSGTFNLTAEGPTDWVNWGILYGGPGLADRKLGVTARISNYTEIGSLVVATTGNDPRTLTWSDGTPNTSGSNSTVVYVDSNSGHPGNGFSFTVSADTTVRTLVVHVGGQTSGGTLTATLSDGSAAAYQDTSPTQSSRYDRNYTLTYSAASAGQTLSIQWVNATDSGNVTLGGAALK